MIHIGARPVGLTHRPYLIAEMSGNHNQSLERALAIVQAAADSGADAIKLQTYTADTMTLDLRKPGFVIEDPFLPDEVAPGARQQPIEDLPDEVMLYLLGSRYCETDRLSGIAWANFGGLSGWALVQAIVTYTHERIRFDYKSARSEKTAWDAHEERVGVCRDYAHLAIALSRCMNVPARYCTGYMGDMDLPALEGDMDFSAWFEAYLDGRWYVFDARHNRPRKGRILMARGRDATDAALTTAFGAATLTRFQVYTDENRLPHPPPAIES
jgi:transglutaminase-like putative cysteine protease